jgi:DNA recombination protein RmuC
MNASARHAGCNQTALKQTGQGVQAHPFFIRDGRLVYTHASSNPLAIFMESQVGTLVSVLAGVIVGAAAIWLLLRERISSAEENAKGESRIEVARLGERLAALQEDANRLTREKDQLAALRDQLTAEQQRLSNQIAELTTILEAERNQNTEKIALLKNAEEQLSNRFKTLASEILEEKSQRFTAQNQTNINQLLEPLKAKITEFQGKVQEVYVQEGKDRSALAEQVRHLMSLNKQLSEDAHNLTSALKGQAKTQGNWGELILERVLEASGLRKGHEYQVQESHTRADGSRAQPDVVVHLPEGRNLIVDAKVSLTAYEEHANAETELQRDAALKLHLDSVRAHIRELSEKNYQQLYGLQSLDFVMMFIPVEPAFMLAISHDSNLWQDAWKRNVLLVSPSTLMFVVRTVAHLWRQEQQTRNAQEIASRGAELYDKLVGFVEDLENLGNRLKQAQTAYDGAYSKFSGGRGNVIRQAEMLKELGVKPTRHLPKKLTDSAIDELPGDTID